MTSLKNTTVYPIANSWIALTSENRAGKNWEIITHVTEDGKGIRTISFPDSKDDKITEITTLLTEEVEATENSIREQHTKALLLFSEGMIPAKA
jgi:hypothetical protein